MPESKLSRSRKPSRRLRILLAHEDNLILEAFGALLESEFEIVARVTDRWALQIECRRKKPDVVLLDLTMTDMGAGRRLPAQNHLPKLLCLVASADSKVKAEMERLGASGYVLKSAAGADLRRAIRKAAQGRHKTNSTFTHRSPEASTVLLLTDRQRQVLRLVAEGRSMKEVGQLLNVTPRTVAFHKYTLMDRLHLKTTAELVQFAVKQGVVGQSL
jgi:DNA-binding NarL/FixJ family response regulator